MTIQRISLDKANHAIHWIVIYPVDSVIYFSNNRRLNVWLSFLTEYHGRSFFIDDVWQNSSKLSLYTDASGALGFGAIFGSRWCYGKWPSDWAYCNIAILEFYPIVLSLYLWGHEMSNQCVLFFTDNEAQSCKDKPLMRFVRKLVSICLQHNIVFKAKHTSESTTI